jgi:hypothetical protein
MSGSLKSWVIEGSPDRNAGTEIDRKPNNNDVTAGHGIAPFAVSNSAECRFIRLTQTGKNLFPESAKELDDSLGIEAFEVFGTLLE